MDFNSPLSWALLIGWILTVVLHEFAHGIVAYWGGDYTIRERGGLSLNPIQYIDPVYSLLLPAIIFVMGGVPLPGGVTYIRRDLIRNRAWQVAVSAAGPLMNLTIGLLIALPMHPWLRLMDPAVVPGSPQESLRLFMGAMVWLQLLSFLINLIPVPPLDGFQMLAQFMPPETRAKLMSPQISTMLMLGIFLLLSSGDFFQYFHNGVHRLLIAAQFDDDAVRFFGRSFNRVLFPKSPG